MSDTNKTNRINVSLPAVTERLWREQAEADGQGLSGWVRDCCNANLSVERQRRNVEPKSAGRPRSQPD